MRKAPFSFTVNNKYFETLIDGYQTKAVRGREVYDNDYTYNENYGDGSTFEKNRIPSRALEIDYILLAHSRQELRQKLNALNGEIHKVKDAIIIFDDEKDKYFVGSYYGHEENIVGSSIEGTITFICNDPFKYAKETKTFEGVQTDDGLLIPINNQGNYEAPIKFTIVNNSNNGYVGITKNGIESIEVGTTSGDIDNIADSFGFAFQSAEDIIQAMQKGGHVPPNYVNNDSVRIQERNGTTYVGFAGSATSASSWHGYNGYIDVPTDKQKEDSFILESSWWINESKPEYTGGMSVSLELTLNMVLSVEIYNSNEANISNVAIIKFNDDERYRFTFNADKDAWCSAPYGKIFFEKSGNQFFVQIGDNRQLIFTSMEPEYVKPVRVSFGFWQKTNKTYSTVGWYLLHDTKLRYTNNGHDIANKYVSGDVIEIDGNSGKVYLNGTYSPQDEIIGSTYFDADVGEMALHVSNSDTATPPTVTAEIRERWL